MRGTQRWSHLPVRPRPSARSPARSGRQKEVESKDDPPCLYRKGILSRDGGHFIAVFENSDRAEQFAAKARNKLVERCPGLRYQIEILPFDPEATQQPNDKQANSAQPKAEVNLEPHLPIFESCREPGLDWASVEKTDLDTGAVIPISQQTTALKLAGEVLLQRQG